MIKLRVVGASEDNDELILSNKPRGRRGSHVVPIDRKLLDVLQDAVYARRDEARRRKVGSVPAAEPKEQPKFPPREIQRALRSGASPEQVARTAGVDVAYVEQFYQPILYERGGIVGEAQALYQEKQRLGRSALPLGEAVEHNLTARHVRLSDDALARAWSATRQEGQPWVVSLTFPFRGRSRKATWRYDPRGRSLVPQNKLATDIGWVPNGKVRAARAAEPSPLTVVSAPKGEASGGSRGARAKPKPARRKPARAKPKPARRKTARAKPKPARRKAARAKPKPARRKAMRAKPKPARRPSARKPARAKPKPARRKPSRAKPRSARPKTTRRATTRKPARARRPAARKRAGGRRTTPRRAPARRRPRSRRR